VKTKTSRPKRKPITVEEFVRQREQDPEYLARLEESEKKRQVQIREFRRAAAPMMEDLRQAGYDVRDSPQELVWQFGRTKVPYSSAVPILLKWLSRVSSPDVKETIVRTLSVPWAKEAAPALFREFREAAEPPANETTWKWAIGNAFSVIADDTIFNDLVDLVRDKRHGRDREMLALALGNMKDERAVDVLIELLQDGQVAGHAIIALGKLKAKLAEPYIERFLSDPKTWVRQEATKALKRIRRAVDSG